MLVSECAAGSAFQVTFKFAPCHLLPERSVEDQFPGPEFPGVSGLAAIMLVHAVTQIVRESGIGLRGIRDTSEEIDVIHYGPPSRDTGRLYDAT
jgi:hypothetical protein